ncbi:MAG: DNA helicase (Rad25 homolog) [uncultured Thermomicrobiales bacterium]|uniref:DNA 3'-5' helicase n=1 Tax=uncultured Thermomicrobiales bacterium TaxID=1645740 RepID=A0A6J4UXV6_9BACT|nr:MAG: DNA helicase (Rad25 homolog) [uncultured Thermomicrobiales bacterium]
MPDRDAMEQLAFDTNLAGPPGPGGGEPDEPDDLFAVLADDADATGADGGADEFAAPPTEYALVRPLQLTIKPRVYQTEALAAWLRGAGRGVIVLPTGAGKTVVALMAIERLAVRTLVIVPTIELLGQWRAGIAERLGLHEDEVGIVGGGKRLVRDITVITFDSAAMPSRQLRGFGLLIVDEAHHLPATHYRQIVHKVGAPYRLGLSATPERQDGRHRDLDTLLGPVVFHKLPADLARDRHIADYVEKRIHVNLSPEEQGRYDALMAEYRWFLATNKIQAGPQFYQELVRRAGHDPAARAAMRAHHQARMISLNAEAKIDETARLLATHREDKVIIFSEYNALVDEMSRRLLLPSITYRTEPVERRAILAGFREGRYSKLVTGRVLNEGVDVPDANVAIVASGSSATREYVQRLGRILRPKPRQAILYELITRKTSEGQAAKRRRPKTNAA